MSERGGRVGLTRAEEKEGGIGFTKIARGRSEKGSCAAVDRRCLEARKKKAI